MLTRYVETIRADNEPTLRVLAMLHAVATHVDDLIGDDPGDRPRLERNVLERLEANIKMVRTDFEELMK